MVESMVVLALGALLIAVPLFWMLSAPGGYPAQTRRFVSVIIAYGIVAVSLGLWWLPPISALATVDRSTTQFAPARGQIDCADAETAMTTVREVSAGNVEIRRDGQLIVVAPLWSRLDPGQQDAVLNLARQIVRCSRPSAGAVAIRVVDRDSQTLIERKSL